MQGCFGITVLIVLGVLLVVSLIRWFEQTTDAVQRDDWARLLLLVVAPFAVWFYPSRIAAGRPTAVPRHTPVRGFGKAPLATDAPPPGTPQEFIGLPKIPPKKPKAAIDPDKIAKLKQKMREQGMLPPE
jgi:hypothetical protein